MNRYDIAIDFKKKFIEQNENVWRKTIKTSFIAINGNDVKVSSNPFSMENAEHGLVIFHYTYTVISQSDSCMVPLFFNSNGEIEDYIEIDGWKLYFDKPITSSYRCDSHKCYMTNGVLKLSLIIRPWLVDEEFKKLWHLFSMARTCETQKELDYAYKIYKDEENILALKMKNLKNEVKINELNLLLDAHKSLIDRIKKLVNIEDK